MINWILQAEVSGYFHTDEHNRPEFQLKRYDYFGNGETDVSPSNLFLSIVYCFFSHHSQFSVWIIYSCIAGVTLSVQQADVIALTKVVAWVCLIFFLRLVFVFLQRFWCYLSWYSLEKVSDVTYIMTADLFTAAPWALQFVAAEINLECRANTRYMFTCREHIASWAYRSM